MSLQRRNLTTLSAVLIALIVWVFGSSWVAGESLVSRAAAKDAPPAKLKLAGFALPTDQFSEKAAALFNHVVRENFARDEKFEVLDIRGMFFSDDADERLRLIEQANSAMVSGREEYDNLELDVAVEKLQKAIDLYKKAVGRLGDGGQYVDALLFMGAAYILSGDDDLGSQSFLQVALFDKRKNLDTKTFPPSMIEVFNRVKERVASSPQSTVMVRSNPPAAEVYLNGVFKGVTPIKLTRVVEGSHFMRIERDGYQNWGQIVSFFATHEELIEATLKPASGLGGQKERTKKVLNDLEADPPAFPLVKLGEWAGANRLAVLKVTQRKNQISVKAVLVGLSPRAKIAYRTANFDITSSNFLGRADAFVTSLYRKVKMPPAGGLAGPGGDKKPKDVIVRTSCNSNSDCAQGEVCSEEGVCVPFSPAGPQWYEKWWIWAIVGGGVAVATTAGVLTWYFLQPQRGAIEFSF